MTRRGKGRTCSTEKPREEFFSLLDEIKDFKIIVEGIKDKKALEEFGFSDVSTINRNKGLYDVAMSFKGEVLVFTDFDSEGEEISKKLSELLRKTGCRVDTNTRRKLRRLFIKNKINTVEGLKRLKFK
ncbi:MAG: hypothetical protein KAT37_03710 [Candidatus Aenigmarchaeota archaeon]|nr:hypothetical protein [Candidatus Aenigmarchaeota archaeon]